MLTGSAIWALCYFILHTQVNATIYGLAASCLGWWAGKYHRIFLNNRPDQNHATSFRMLIVQLFAESVIHDFAIILYNNRTYEAEKSGQA